MPLVTPTNGGAGNSLGQGAGHGHSLNERRSPPGSIDITFDLNEVVKPIAGVIRGGISLASWGERQALGLLRARLDATRPASTESPSETSADTARNLVTTMNDLLSRAVERSSAASRLEVFDRLLSSLLPDEAKIISALSDGCTAAVISVYARNRTGSPGEQYLKNMSLIARTANLTLPTLTPIYVGRLKAAGLVRVVPESPALREQYEILAADPAVLIAAKNASRGALPARIERRTLTISELGSQFWAATRGSQPT